MLGGSKQAEWNKKFAEYSDAISKFNKSQPTTMTPEKFLSMTYASMLATNNPKLLRAYKAKGWHHADKTKDADFYKKLNKAIAKLESGAKGN